MYLKGVSRIAALLCVYFFVLLVEALLERELRRTMAQSGLENLPLYPEGRACRRPTARRVIDLFDEVQRHELKAANQPPVSFTTDLTPFQCGVAAVAGDGEGVRRLSWRAAETSEIINRRSVERQDKGRMNLKKLID